MTGFRVMSEDITLIKTQFEEISFAGTLFILPVQFQRLVESQDVLKLFQSPVVVKNLTHPFVAYG